MAERAVMMTGVNETYPNLTRHDDIYATINPQSHFTDQTFSSDKTVLITSASRSIGCSTALFYARAGASLVLVAGSPGALQDVLAAIEGDAPQMKVLLIGADVRNTQNVREAVESAVGEFGRLDVLVASAGLAGEFSSVLGETDPDAWWEVVKVNVVRTYNAVQ